MWGGDIKKTPTSFNTCRGFLQYHREFPLREVALDLIIAQGVLVVKTNLTFFNRGQRGVRTDLTYFAKPHVGLVRKLFVNWFELGFELNLELVWVPI